MKRLWKSDRSISFTNSFFLSSVPRAWFLNTTSSSHRRLTLKSFGFNSGLPRAMSNSRCSSSFAALSASSLAFASALSFFIFANSRINSAVSSSSSSSSSPLLSLLSLLPPSESASISLASSNIRRLRFASDSSFSSTSSPVDVSSCRFGIDDEISGDSLSSGADPPFFFAKCTASAFRSSARRSRTSLSALPPCPGCLCLRTV